MDTDNNTLSDPPVKRVWPVRGGIILGVIIALGVLIFGILRFFENVGVENIFVLGYDFVAAPTNRLAGVNGRTNILVMGKAGGLRSADSPDLTDTIILVSLGIQKKDITVVSIPRDVWIPEIRAKINAAYYWGTKNTPYFENSGNRTGISFAKMVTQEVTGTPVQYGIVIDFSSFKDIIDAIGGIRVDVANSFTDNLYPIEGKENDLCGGDPTFACRYKTVTFNSGQQDMNGDTALIFVRSRHAEGTEGTDLAREARQQKVINAIKNKITDPKIFLSPKVDIALIGILKKYVETDVDGSTAATLARLVVNDYKIIHEYLIPDNLLFNPPVNNIYDQQYVFIPAAGNGNWSDINKWFSSVLK